jgi:hypothetical protein
MQGDTHYAEQEAEHDRQGRKQPQFKLRKNWLLLRKFADILLKNCVSHTPAGVLRAAC